MQTKSLAVVFLWLLSGNLHSAVEDPIDFQKQILPLLQKNCLACHHRKEAEGGVILETQADILKGGDEGPFLVPGNVAASKLIKILAGSVEPLMPPKENSVGAKQLSPEEIVLVTKWIEQGAKGSMEVGSKGPNWNLVSTNLQPIYATASTLEGQYAIVGRGNRILVYQWPSLAGAKEVVSLIDPAVDTTLGKENTKSAHLDLVQSIAISPDGDWIASGGYRELKLWKKLAAPSNRLQESWQGRKPALVKQFGSHVWVSFEDHTAMLYDVDTNAVLGKWRGLPSAIQAMTLSPTRDRIAISEASGKVHVAKIPPNAEAEVDWSTSRVFETGTAFDQLELLADEAFMGRSANGRIALYLWKPSADEAATPSTWELAPLFRDLEGVTALASSSQDAKRIAIAQGEGIVKIHNIPGGEAAFELQHGSKVQLMVVTPDRSRLLTFGDKGSCKLWNLQDGKLIGEVPLDHRLLMQEREIQQSVQRQTAKIAFLEAKLPELEKAKTSEVEAKGKQQAAKDKVVESLKAKEGEVAAATAKVTESETALAAAKAAMEEAMKKVAAIEKEIVTKKEAVAKAQAAKDEVAKEVVKFDQVLASADEAIARATQAIPQFQAQVDGEKKSLVEIQGSLAAASQKKQEVAPVTVAQFTPDASRLLLLHADKIVRAVHFPNLKPEAGIPLAGNTEIQGRSALVANGAGDISVIGPTGEVQGMRLAGDWKLAKTIGNATESPFPDRITALDVSPDRKHLLVAGGQPSRTGELKIFSAETGELVLDMGEVHSDTIFAAKYSPDGKWIATASADKVIRIFDLQGKLTKTLEGHTHHVLAIDWQDGGQVLASASADMTVKIWDVFTGQQKRTISGFGKEVTSVDFVGQGNQIVTSCADRIVRLHESTDGKLIRAFDAAADSLYASSLLDDGTAVLAGGQDGVATIWKLDNSKPTGTLSKE